MNTKSKNKFVKLKKILVVLIAAAVCLTGLPGIKNEARADKTGAFLGGLLAGGLVAGAVNRDKQRTQAAEYQAYSQPRYVQQAPAPAPAPAPAQQSPEARIQELDKLAAGGYITPEEYKAKKQAILDGM
jgi:hypothetical protein